MLDKVTFLEPPVLDNTRTAERVFGCASRVYPVPNIFVLTAAAVLERSGYDVHYLDAATKRWSEEDFKNFLIKDDSSAYLFYSVNLSQQTDLLAAGLIRRLKKDAAILFIGPAPTDRPSEFLVDERTYVLRGEFEGSLVEALSKIDRSSELSNIQGISFVHGNEVIDTPSHDLLDDLDALPFPARHLIEKDRYFNPMLGVRPYTTVATSRGCAYRCIYCVPCSLSFAREIDYKRSHGNNKPPVRMRSAENVIEEFNLLKKQGYKAVSIIDDQFIWGKKRTLAICQGIKDLSMKWVCLARADSLDEDIAEAMAEAGCREVSIGVESFCQEILDYVHKDLRVETISQAIKILQKYKILAKLNILVGSSPLETIDTLNHTLRNALKAKPDWIMFNICNPFPGTKFYEIALENKWVIDGKYRAVDVQKQAIIDYPHLSHNEIERWVRNANMRVTFRPSFVFRKVLSQRSSRDLFDAVLALRQRIWS